MDEAALNRVQLERKIDALQDEINFLKKVHEEVCYLSHSLLTTSICSVLPCLLDFTPYLSQICSFNMAICSYNGFWWLWLNKQIYNFIACKMTAWTVKIRLDQTPCCKKNIIFPYLETSLTRSILFLPLCRRWESCTSSWWPNRFMWIWMCLSQT